MFVALFRNLFFFLLLILCIAQVKGQPGCPSIDAGSNQTICSGSCATLTSTYLATGASSSYSVSSIAYAPPYSYNGGTALLVNIDDTWSGVLSIPFTFCFFGAAYTNLVAGSNGVLTFDLANAGNYCDWPLSLTCPNSTILSSSTGPYIMGPFHDIDPAVTGDMYYNTYGSYPCRTFVVSWNQVAMFSSSCNSLLATHMIVLYETTNVIEVYVSNAPVCSSWNSGNKCIGIQNTAGTVGYCPPGRNTGAWSASNEAWRFTPNGASNYVVSWWQGATQIASGATTTVCPASTTAYTAQIVYTNCNSAQVTVTDPVTVTVNTAPVADAGSPQTICTGQSTTLTATGGGTYAWNTGQTTSSITVTPGSTTTYTVTVTSGGCTASDNVTVTVNSSITPDAGSPQTICAGQSATLTATGGTSYVWNTGATTQSITVTPASTSTYTVTASIGGCSGTDNVVVTVNPLPTADAGSPQTICAGQSATLTASGGGTYSWNTGPTTQSITVTPASTSTYTVTVTLSGCTASDNVVVTVNPLPTADAGLPQTICPSASATLTASGGGTYSWNTGPTTQSITVNPAATTTYTVTVTLSGCTASDNVTVTVNTAITADAGSPQTICNGQSATLTASGGSAYAWSNGGNTQSITVSPTTTTTYTVTASSGGCSGTDNVVVTVNPLPVADAGTPQTICIGSSATLTASGGGTYQWDTGPTTQSITITPATTTTYTVTVTLSGCTASDNATITVNPLPTADAGLPQTVCPTFSATLTASGGGTYSWNTGPTTQSITVTPASTTTYTVTVTLNGCTASDNVTVTVSAGITADAGSPQTICDGQSATLTASGGSTYAWSNGGSTQTITVTPTTTTTYTVTVSSGGCSGTDNVVITVNPTPTATAGTDQIICIGQSANLTAFGGGTYLWSNSSTNQSTNVSPTTTTMYTVTVTGTGGCTASDDVQVTVNPLPNAEAGPNQSICYGNSTTLNASGGTAYEWSPSLGLSSTTVNNPTANPTTTTTYTVTVTDVNGCSSTDDMTLTVNTLPVVSAGSDQSICLGSSANINASGGTSYSWSPSTGLSPTTSANPIANPIVTTTYTVTAIDANGCSGTDDIIITVNSIPTSSFTLTSPICIGGTSTITYTGTGSPAATYSWDFDGGTVGSGSGQGPYQVSWSTPSTYTVSLTVTENGCTSSVTTVNQVVGQLLTTIAVTDSITCNGASDGEATVTATGASPYQYNWSNFQLGATAVNLSANTYTVTVTDANGCTGTQSIIMTEPAPLTMSFSYTDVSCNGGSNGTATAIVAGGTTSYQYSWIPVGTGGNVNTVTTLQAGTYTLTVYDLHGCTVDTTFTVSEPPLLTYTYVTDSVDCNGGADGSINIVTSGGNPPYGYSWVPNVSSGPSATNLAAGPYNVTISDNNSCSTLAVITVSEPPALVLSNSGDVTICMTQSTTISATATGGTGAYTFTWDNGLGVGSSFIVTPLTTTTYTVSVTDGNGCTAPSLSLTVFVSPPINVSLSSSPSAICQGESSVLTATANGGNGIYTYNWSGIGVSTSSITVSPVTTTTYYVTVTDNCNSPQDVDSITITVYPLPQVQFISDTVNGCEPLVISFTDLSTPAISSWSWNFGDPNSGSGNISTQQNPTHMYGDAGTYTVSLTVTTTNGCTGSIAYSNMIEVYPTPDAYFTYDPQTISIFDPNVHFIDMSNLAYDWDWDFGDPGSLSENTSDEQSPMHMYTNPGTYYVTLVITSQYGCVDSTGNYVVVNPEFTFYAPSAFTPDGNGKNDYFAPKGEGWDLDNYEFYIFDRWGEKIFETNDYNEQWDGKKEGSSEVCMQGVYSWLVVLKDYADETHSYYGRVTLLRK